MAFAANVVLLVVGLAMASLIGVNSSPHPHLWVHRPCPGVNVVADCYSFNELNALTVVIREELSQSPSSHGWPHLNSCAGRNVNRTLLAMDEQIKTWVDQTSRTFQCQQPSLSTIQDLSVCLLMVKQFGLMVDHPVHGFKNTWPISTKNAFDTLSTKLQSRLCWESRRQGGFAPIGFRLPSCMQPSHLQPATDRNNLGDWIMEKIQGHLARLQLCNHHTWC